MMRLTPKGTQLSWDHAEELVEAQKLHCATLDAAAQAEVPQDSDEPKVAALQEVVQESLKHTAENLATAAKQELLTNVLLILETIANKSYVANSENPMTASQADSSSNRGNRFSSYNLNNIPVENQFVSKYSDFVCDNIGLLSAPQLARFIDALAKPTLPVDEFWMFMLGKGIQEKIGELNARQIVQVGRAFADRYLEDDDFFEVANLYSNLGINEFE